jgi:hypothetical protein
MIDLKKLLEDPLPWPHSLSDKVSYTRFADDHDGEWDQHIIVQFGGDGDAYIATHDTALMRFRNTIGGGDSPRTYRALVILAEAIRLDALERPQPRR